MSTGVAVAVAMHMGHKEFGDGSAAIRPLRRPLHAKIPYFYEGAKEHGPPCPPCSEKLTCVGKDGDMEVKEEYRGKIIYQGEATKEHLVMGVMFG